jgi:two-component system response regulator HydG
MKRILVVDDDPGMVRTLKDVLRLHGWDVDGASSGAEAVEAVERKAYTAVLMDVRMPGMDGLAAFHRIHLQRPAVPVILMTAFAADHVIDEAERTGVMKILPKPLDLRHALRMLDDVLMTTQAVLVVDDENEFLTTLAAALRAHGHAVVEAGSLQDAVAFAQDGAPRVILLHLHLDALDPTHAVRAIREVNPGARLIVYSGRPADFERTVSELPAGDVLAALPKPLPMGRLLSMLDDALAN